MNDAELFVKDIKNIFCRHIDNLSQILCKEYIDIKTCNGQHSQYIKIARSKMLWHKRLSYTNLALTMILVFTLIGIWIFRSFNSANRYGGCVTNFLWPFDECPTAF